MENKCELLCFISENINMGLSSISYIIKLLEKTDNKIKESLTSEEEKYKEYDKKCKRLEKKYKLTVDHSKKIVKLMASINMNIELMKDNSDAKIADMLIKGYTMGNLELTKKIESLSTCKKDIISLANSLLKYGTKEIENLKEYL
ncbi:MAG: hypothetical protein RSB41_02560 [Bacilli bacterium]